MTASTATDVEFQHLFDDQELSFSDAVAISGIDARQLRNGLDRGSLSVGSKLRVGRWAFSLRDCFELFLIARLTANTWMPVSVAAEVARRIAPNLGLLLDDLKTLAAEMKAKGGGAQIQEFIIHQSNSGIVVVLHKRGGDSWGFYTLGGERLATAVWADAHIRLPVVHTINEFMERTVAIYQDINTPARVAVSPNND